MLFSTLCTIHIPFVNVLKTEKNTKSHFLTIGLIRHVSLTCLVTTQTRPGLQGSAWMPTKPYLNFHFT